MKENPEGRSDCRCCRNWTMAVRDLHLAVERMTTSGIMNPEIASYLEAYRNGIVAVENRFIRTMGKEHCPSAQKPEKERP